ncbi:MAG: hypothetical protein F9K22_11125 [Bacteroidetes bacterium]|nr:MAG: hypothetical protein F9K22_11125 [Bacteroidota bacterium]
MDTNALTSTAGALTAAYFTVNSTAIRGEINNSGNRQPVPVDAILAVYDQMLNALRQRSADPLPI